MSQTTPNVVLQWLLPVVVVGVGVGYGALYYFPNLQERALLTRREQDGNNAQLMNELVTTTLATDQNRLRLLHDSLNDVEDLRLTEKKVALLPGQLHQLAEGCGVQIAQLIPNHSLALDSYLQQRYTLRLNATVDQLLSFLCQLETKYPSIRITQLNSSFSQASQVNSVQLILEVFADYSEDSD